MMRILIIKHGSLGDIIFSLPVMHSIYLHFINEKIDILSEERYLNFLSKTNFFKKLIKDNRSLNFFTNLKLLLNLKINKYDIIIDLQNSSRTSCYHLFFRIFAKQIISSSRKFSHFRYIIPIQGFESATQGLFNQIKLINIKKAKDIRYDWLEVKLGIEFQDRFVLFIIGVSVKGKYKQWDPIKFAELAKYCEDKNYKVCLIGTAQDRNCIEPILQKCKNVINKLDSSPPDIIYSISKKAQLIISNDTGPGHIASLSKKNILWILNDNKISKANIDSNPNNYKVVNQSVKNITSKEVISYIERKNLL